MKQKHITEKENLKIAFIDDLIDARSTELRDRVLINSEELH
jgi:hypothetical protein